MIRLKIDPSTIDAEETSIEDYLLKVVQVTPRSELKKAFQEKQIRVNGRAVTRSHLLRANDEVEVTSESVFKKSDIQVLANSNLKLQTLAESDKLIVINKPSGLNCHPQNPSENDTVLNALAAHDPRTLSSGDPQKPLEGGLAHRIDRGTSGALICAKDHETFVKLKSNWKDTTKVYLAWVKGAFEQSGTLTVNLFHSPKSKKKMLASAEILRGAPYWPAKTEFLPVHFSDEHTLILIQIHTGVMHQIRASLAYLGFSIVGDELYETEAAKARALQKAPHEIEPLGLDLPLIAKVELLDFKALSGPQLAKLPGFGFFLHAFYIKHPAFKEIESGLFAPIPDYF